MKRTLVPPYNIDKVVGVIVQKGQGDLVETSPVFYFTDRQAAINAKKEYKAKDPAAIVIEARPTLMDSKTCIQTQIESGEIKLNVPLEYTPPMDFVIRYYTPEIREGILTVSGKWISEKMIRHILDSFDYLRFDYTISQEPSFGDQKYNSTQEVLVALGNLNKSLF